MAPADDDSRIDDEWAMHRARKKAEADAEVPPRTHYLGEPAATPWGESRNERKAKKQHFLVDREMQRTAEEHPTEVVSPFRRFWRGLRAKHCTTCGGSDGRVHLDPWREQYVTTRCRYCLTWTQARIQRSSSSGGG